MTAGTSPLGGDRTGARQQNARGQSGLRAGASTSHAAPWCLLQLQRLPSHLVTGGGGVLHSTGHSTRSRDCGRPAHCGSGSAVSLSRMDRLSM